MTLERAYRRLLACYPWEHRRQYEQEMLGVLLDDAAPGQRRPRAGEVIDLLVGALRSRIRYAVADVTDRRWRDAVGVLSLLAPLAMLAYTARPLLLAVGQWVAVHSWDVGPLLRWHSAPRAAAWAVVLVLVLTGLRRIAAVVAWGGVALEAVRAVDDYAADSWGYVTYSVHDLWPLALAIVAAATLTAGAARPGAALLGRGRCALLGGAALLGSAAPAIGLLAHSRFPEGDLRTIWIFTRAVTYLEGLLLIAGLAAGLAAVLGTPAPLRRRLFALLAPVAATLVLTRIGFIQWSFLAQPFVGASAGLRPVQWLALVATPPLTLAVSVAVVRRRERTLRLIALGRAADRQAPTGAGGDPTG